MDTTASTSRIFSLRISVDEAIDRLGYGAFQRRVLFGAGLCSASDAMEILLLSFLALSVQAEWDLSSQQSSSLIAVVFAGAFFGTLLLGRLGDVMGRKPAFVTTAAIVATFGLVTCFCQNYPQLIVARFLVGVGIGGVTVPFDTYSEFLPSGSRGQNLALPSYFWTTGTLMVAAIAHWTLGQDSSGSGWRLLCFWSSIPCIVATIVGALVVPESPRWILTHKRDQDRALRILKEAAQLNGKDPDMVFPQGTTITINSSDHQHDDPQSISVWELLSPRWWRTSLVLWTVWACYAFLYYGTVLAVTTVFSSSSTSEGNDDHSIRFDYGAIFASTLAEVAGATFVFLTIDRFGRRPTHAVSFLLGGSFVLSFCLVANSSETDGSTRILLVAIAFFARMFIFSGSAITWIWTAEILTTDVRSTGHSVANAAGRIGGFLAPYVVSKTTPFPVIGATMMLVSLLVIACSRLLPETYGAPMGEAIPDHTTSSGIRKKEYQSLSITSSETD
jgi:MFS family permease